MKQPYLSSQDPKDWHEDHATVIAMRELTPKTDPAILRQYYPLRARLLVKCVFHTHDVGHVFEYARTSWTPSLFPIQVWAPDKNGNGHQWAYNSQEVELLPAL